MYTDDAGRNRSVRISEQIYKGKRRGTQGKANENTGKGE
jgi:hypothetical protein